MPLVVTNPDRPAGRKMALAAPPVKEAALRLGFDVVQPQGGRDPELLDHLVASAPDVAVVVAYGSILPPAVLGSVPKGFVNVHFSLLPEYRGAAPVQRAVMDGRAVTGVSTMVLTEGMDEGPVLGKTEYPVPDGATAGMVGDELAHVGAELLLRTLPPYVDGSLEPQPQDHGSATYAPKIAADEARIDWTEPAARIRAKILGLNPAPGAWTTFRDVRIKIHAAVSDTGEQDLAPGEIDARDMLVVGTGDGCLVITEAQPAGKPRMAGADMMRGLRPEKGERFE